ncbi:MAG: amidase [Sterolibacterium sp.]
MNEPVIEERSLSELSADLAAGRTSAQALVAQYLERIDSLDRHGPCLASVIEVNPDAHAIARALDNERSAGRTRGPLHGIPVLIKDNIATRDRMATTAGSLALVGSMPPEDAFLVRRLRAAGAIILGKTNMSEWANGRSLQSSSGWSARGGLTRNPYVLDRSASGSSSGSAVAVAASLCAAAVGTETDGSILSPASVCGVVGMKPTVGLVSRHGVIPISHSLDTPGPLARNVRDCALLLGALSGEDPRDTATCDGAAQRLDDYAAGLDGESLRGARLGVARQFFAFHDLLEPAYPPMLAALERAGAVLVDPVTLPDLDRLGAAKRTVLLYEMKAGLNAYLQGLGPNAPVRSLVDIIAFNQRNAAREMPWFSQDIFLMAQAKGPLSDAEYREALAACRHIACTDGIEAVLREHRLDALIAPTAGPAWCTDLLLGDHAVGGSTSPAAAAGTPSISVPAGNTHGLPLGLSFFGGAWSEMRLLSLAYAFEQATRARLKPRYLPRMESLPPS